MSMFHLCPTGVTPDYSLKPWHPPPQEFPNAGKGHQTPNQLSWQSQPPTSPVTRLIGHYWVKPERRSAVRRKIWARGKWRACRNSNGRPLVPENMGMFWRVMKTVDSTIFVNGLQRPWSEPFVLVLYGFERGTITFLSHQSLFRFRLAST